jgi:hypothetical protein
MIFVYLAIFFVGAEAVVNFRNQLRMSDMSTAVLALGSLCICAGTVADFAIRLRMRSIGRKWVFLRGGTFNYAEYHAVREKHGWPAWPVYFMWMMWIAGIALIIAGCFLNSLARP